MNNMNNEMILQRGDVYLAELPVLENSRIQSGKRAVIITSNELALKHSPVVQYIPVTSKNKKMCLPSHIAMETDIFKEESVALVEQEGCIDKFRLKWKIGTLSEEDMLKIDIAIIRQRNMDKRVLQRIMQCVAVA